MVLPSVALATFYRCLTSCLQPRKICLNLLAFLFLACYVTVFADLRYAFYVMIQLLTAIGLSPGGSSTVHIYTQTIHRTTQNKQYTGQHNNLGECGPGPVLASYTLAFALQLRKKHGKTSVRVAASKNT